MESRLVPLTRSEEEAEGADARVDGITSPFQVAKHKIFSYLIGSPLPPFGKKSVSTLT